MTGCKNYWIRKWIVLFLIIGLAWGGQLIFPRETNLEGLFKWAVKNYLEGKFWEVSKDLELLLSYCDEEQNQLKGKIYLLLGAVNEQMGNTREAIKNYQLSRELLKTPSIEGIDFSSLKEYQRIIKNKQKLSKPGIIEKPRVKPKKKKGNTLLYLVLGGVAIAGLVAFLSTKKDEESAVTLSGYRLFLNFNGRGSVHISYGGPGYYYSEGTEVTLTASPQQGWLFSGWTGDVNTMENPITIIMNSDKNITVNFTEINPGNNLLTVFITGQGTVTLDPPGGVYSQGTTVKLTATPAPGWKFEAWQGDLNRSENPTTILMDSYKNVTALFVDPNANTKTIGYTSVFSKTSSSAYRSALPFTMPENGTISSVTMYHLGGGRKMMLAVYDGEGSPQYRLGVTPETDVSNSTGWQTINLTTPVYVRGGQTIWLAWVYQNNPGIANETGSPGRFRTTIGWYGGMPLQFGSGDQQDVIYSIYATYTPD